MILTKSDFMLFLKHPAWLWLKKNRKNLLPEIDENTKAIFKAGHQFESYAEKLFQNAVKFEYRDDYNDYLLLPNRTQKAIESGAEVILQGRLEIESLTCIFDVLERVKDKEFNLYEIKSSTKVKKEQEVDLAFQTIVLEKAGLSIHTIGIIHINSEYVRKGEIDPTGITVKVDVTEAVRRQMPKVQGEIEQALAVATFKSMPDLSPRFASGGGFSQWKEIYEHLVKQTDPYNIYHLCSTSAAQIGELEDKGITHIADIPESGIEKAKQLHQIRVTRENRQIVEIETVKNFLKEWQYPLYFIDYETFANAIPDFDGLMPFKDYPFQYSLHVLESPSGKLIHKEYLHETRSDPTKDVILSLREHIGESGTLVSWNQAYEKNINKTLMELHPEHAEFLQSVNSRMADLMVPFWNDWIIDKDFFGSASIKKVLPALAPELNYHSLAISNGQTARNEWMQTVLEGENEEIKGQILENLREYCKLDTYAMVRIFQEVNRIIGNQLDF